MPDPRRELDEVHWASLASPVGDLTLAATSLGLLLVSFSPAERALAGLHAERLVEGPGALDRYRRQLEEYFAGQRRLFEIPLDRRLSRGFFARVLRALEGVGYGQTVSYGALAALAGSPRAARAAGSAMATNPIAIVVPCHRVLRSGGELGQYGAGVGAKRWLLEHEGALEPAA